MDQPNAHSLHAQRSVETTLRQSQDDLDHDRWEDFDQFLAHLDRRIAQAEESQKRERDVNAPARGQDNTDRG